MINRRISAAVVLLGVMAVSLAPSVRASWTSSPSIVSTITSSGQPFGLHLSTDGTRAWVTNYSGNSVSIFDTSTNQAIAGSPISVGQTPWDVVFSPDGSRAWVSNYNVTTSPPGRGTTVSVINTTTSPPSVIHTVTVGFGPTGMAMSPNGDRLWVANFNGASVNVIDTTANPPVVVQTISLSGKNPIAVAISPDGARAYVVDYLGSVTSIDTATYAVNGSLSVGSGLQKLVLSSDGQQGWVSGLLVYRLDTSGSIPALLNTSADAANGGLALTPDESRLWVVSQFGNAAYMIDASTLQMITGSSVALGQQPQQVAVTPDGTRAWVTGWLNNEVLVLNTGFSAGDSSQWPTTYAQEFSVPEGTTSSSCADLAPDAVDWPGVAHLHRAGWRISYSPWPNGGSGGWVCARQPYYNGVGWSVR
jgi:YVTN family beta-propeller protein